MMSEGNTKGRFHSEFWLICLIVGLGYVQAMPIGFYRFRLVDLILMLSSLYCFRLLVTGKLDRKAAWLISLYVLVMLVRTFLELETASGTEFMRTLFGMAAAYLAPLIFFVVRESRINHRIVVRLLVLGCLVSLLSQMRLLPWGESYVSGAVNLGAIFGIQTSAPSIELEYQEATITVWRALSVGLTFALLLSKTKPWVKLFGAGAFVLQFAGGGGGRSALIFVFLVPIVLFAWHGSFPISQKLRKIVWVGAIGVCFAAFYLWAPIGGAGAVKGGFEQTHSERVLETSTLFTEGWQRAEEIGGLGARTFGYQEYFTRIMSDPSIFFFGTGLSLGAAFPYTTNILAHNMILDVWGLSGLIGLIFFLIFMTYVVLDLRRLLKATPEGTVRQIIGFSFATAVLFMFQWLFVQAATADRSFMIVFYLLAGLLKPMTRWLQGNSVTVRE